MYELYIYQSMHSLPVIIAGNGIEILSSIPG